MSLKRNYGGKNWTKLWQVLEQEGNVGIDYVINPYLYSEIARVIGRSPGAMVADFGAGTGILGLQFMYGYQAAVPGLQGIKNLNRVRKNVSEFISFEGSRELVKKGREYLVDVGSPDEITVEQLEIEKGIQIPLADNYLALAISRQFLMHLSVADLAFHLQEVHRVLAAGGYYIVAILNPEYEQIKYQGAQAVKRSLVIDQRYAFSHGAHGEHGTFYHSWKDVPTYERMFEEHFTLNKKLICLPVTDVYRQSHSRYYDPKIPMAFVYVLKKKL